MVIGMFVLHVLSYSLTSFVGFFENIYFAKSIRWPGRFEVVIAQLSQNPMTAIGSEHMFHGPLVVVSWTLF